MSAMKTGVGSTPASIAMTAQANPRLLSASASLSRAASVLVGVVGGAVLIGWMLDIAPLKSVLPGLVTMKPNTALALLLSGVSLWLSRGGELGRTRQAQRRIAHACAIVVVVIGLLTLVEYLSGLDLGIDQRLFAESSSAVGTFAPGRMAPTTALDFLMIGLALVLLEAPRASRAVAFLALTAGAIGLLNLVGYVYGVQALYGLASYTQMALHTSVVFVVLGVGVISARPDRGPMAALVSGTVGGTVLRRLLPAAIGVPFVLGWLVLSGNRAGLYDAIFGLAFFALADMVVLAIVIWWHATVLHRADAARQGAEDATRNLNVELERRAAELAAANRELEAFSYSVSHDLRAPLRAIQGFSRVLVEDHAARLDAEGHRVLGIVTENTRQMGELIDDLLRFARISRQEIEPTVIDMTRLARLVVAECRQLEPDRDVTVTIDPLPVARGDQPMVRQALVNLISNAFKFTRPRPDARIEIGGEEGPAEATYFVRDNGVGFDPRYADQLFKVFQRLHASTEFEGTGIGLAIVARVVHRHGGRVWADGIEGEGATFAFALPRKGGTGDA